MVQIRMPNTSHCALALEPYSFAVQMSDSTVRCKDGGGGEGDGGGGEGDGSAWASLRSTLRLYNISDMSLDFTLTFHI